MATAQKRNTRIYIIYDIICAELFQRDHFVQAPRAHLPAHKWAQSHFQKKLKHQAALRLRHWFQQLQNKTTPGGIKISRVAPLFAAQSDEYSPRVCRRLHLICSAVAGPIFASCSLVGRHSLTRSALEGANGTARAYTLRGVLVLNSGHSLTNGADSWHWLSRLHVTHRTFFTAACEFLLTYI